MIEVGALWKSKDGQKSVMSGKFGNARVVIIPNQHKKAENHPDYKMMIVEGFKQKPSTEDENPF